jgi:diguanylate cyclase (GGDEF)-like protein
VTTIDKSSASADTADSGARSDTADSSARGATARPRLLVVDDQPLNIQTLYQIFQADHEIFMATGGKQALEACLLHQPDLILLDIVMPGMDGIEVCRRLKNNPKTREIPVIFVTSQGSPDEETLGLEVGAVDFISKPVNPSVVRARVNAHLILKAQSDLLKSLAFVDGLTGVANRRQFDERLAMEWRACSRNGTSLAVALIDIDHFKLYNDRYGHQQGDDSLTAVAKALRAGLGRAHDLLARYGGEEFACVLPDCDIAGAMAVGRGLLDAVKNLRIPHEASETADIVTVSIGVAAATPSAEITPTDLLVTADHQLYRAKLRGRNSIEGTEGLVASQEK